MSSSLHGLCDLWHLAISFLATFTCNEIKWWIFWFEISANGCKGAHQTPLWGFVCRRSTPSILEGDTEFPRTKKGSYICLFFSKKKTAGQTPRNSNRRRPHKTNAHNWKYGEVSWKLIWRWDRRIWAPKHRWKVITLLADSFVILQQ